MKSLLAWLFLCSAMIRAAEPLAAGEWSKEVKGLRGRLVLVESKPVNGTRIARVYLELENVSNTLSPILIERNTPEVQVTDAAGKVLPQMQASEDRMYPEPFTLVLPLDATIRLRFFIAGWDIWILREKGVEEYLTGTFSIPEKERPSDLEGLRKVLKEERDAWRGTLELPRVKLPTVD